MHSENVIVVGAGRPTSGPVSLTQGRYGARGNLELLACDSRDGLWVFWFNADEAEDPLQSPDVPAGCWSAGLAFASGRHFVDAQIVQSTLGPDHLEVVALTDAGTLESWYWSPGPGFQRRVRDVAASVRRFRLTHDGGVLHVSLELTGGSSASLVSGTDGYPDRMWRASSQPPVFDDGSAERALQGQGITDVASGTARAAQSTRNGGTTELAWRDRSGRVRHLAVPDSGI
ncbi:hypothetical protein [Microbacterium alcoholitolerans]|uniref:hypothetical protein n=1 Tax=unclassified Microbacterium TaxID=2609290 RepID=UPI003D182A85